MDRACTHDQHAYSVQPSPFQHLRPLINKASSVHQIKILIDDKSKRRQNNVESDCPVNDRMQYLKLIPVIVKRPSKKSDRPFITNHLGLPDKNSQAMTAPLIQSAPEYLLTCLGEIKILSQSCKTDRKFFCRIEYVCAHKDAGSRSFSALSMSTKRFVDIGSSPINGSSITYISGLEKSLYKHQFSLHAF